MKNKGASTYLTDVGRIIADLTTAGWQPVMIGGMALVVLGSRRVTQDFDFVISNPCDRFDDFIDVFYTRGFVLASQINEQGKITSTIKSRHTAKKHLSSKQPTSVFFINPKTDLKIDVLFDFPIPAKNLLQDAIKIKIGSQLFSIASEIHLLQLKQLATTSRRRPGDQEDLLFLKNLLKRK